jgi:hypothetical protein
MARKPKPIHSGDWPFVFEGDRHYHNHVAASTEDALQGCIRLIKGIKTKSEREALVGHLLAALIHDKSIDGLMRAVTLAGLSVNHYHAVDPTRAY